jgi:hypothetical protein
MEAHVGGTWRVDNAKRGEHIFHPVPDSAISRRWRTIPYDGHLLGGEGHKEDYLRRAVGGPAFGYGLLLFRRRRRLVGVQEARAAGTKEAGALEVLRARGGGDIAIDARIHGPLDGLD